LLEWIFLSLTSLKLCKSSFQHSQNVGCRMLNKAVPRRQKSGHTYILKWY